MARRGVVSLGFDAGGKRIRKKVSGQTRTEVKDKLKALHSDLNTEHATALRDALVLYISAACRVAGNAKPLTRLNS